LTIPTPHATLPASNEVAAARDAGQESIDFQLARQALNASDRVMPIAKIYGTLG